MVKYNAVFDNVDNIHRNYITKEIDSGKYNK